MKRRRALFAIGAAAAAVGLAAGPLIAQTGEGGTRAASTPGALNVDRSADEQPRTVTTGGATYDPTVLTKFIPALGFVALQGTALEADNVSNGGSNCVAPGSAGGQTVLRAPVELPDGAKITSLSVFSVDNNVANIDVSLLRSRGTFPTLFSSSPSVAGAVVASFSTAGQTGFGSASFDIPGGEVVGSFRNSTGLVLGPGLVNFHTLEVVFQNSAGADNALCGVEVFYQVPSTLPAAASVFVPIDPVRVYDSRQAVYAPNNTVVAPNTSRVLSVKDGRSSTGAVTLADAVPSGATAVTYNLTVTGITGPNFLAITPGGATSYTASAINFTSTDLANGGTVKLDATRQVKVWGGDQSGSAHVIIDVTGYYAPAALPNMAN